MLSMDLDALMKKVKENKCEICFTIMPDGETHMEIYPWERTNYRTITEAVEDKPEAKDD